MSIKNGYNPMCRIGDKGCTQLDKKLSEDIPGLTSLQAKWYSIYYNSHIDKKGTLFEDLDYKEQLDKMKQTMQDVAAKEFVDKKAEELGYTSKTRSYLTRLFADNITERRYRQEVIEDLAAMFSNTIQNHMMDPKNAGISRLGIIKKYGIDGIFEEVKTAYVHHLQKYTADLVKEGIISNEVVAKIQNGEITFNDVINKLFSAINNPESYLDTSLHNNIDKVRAVKYLNTILNTPGMWAATIMLAKSKLLDYERVKLGYASEMATLVDNLDDFNSEEASGDNEESAYDDIMDAENTTLENWMLKADTRSPASGISAEVRGFLNSILIKEDLVPRTVLGSLHRGNMHEMFNQLLDIMEAGYKDSDQLFNALENIRANIASYVKNGRSTKDIKDYDDFDEYLADESHYEDKTYESYINSGLYVMMEVLKRLKKHNKAQYYQLKTLIFNNFNKALIDYTTLDTTNNNFGIKYNEENVKNALITFINDVRQTVGSDGVVHTIYTSDGQIDISALTDLSKILADEVALINTDKTALTNEHKFQILSNALIKLNLAGIVNIDYSSIISGPDNSVENANNAYLSLIETLRSFATGLNSVGNILKLKGNYGKAVTNIENLINSKYIRFADTRETHFEGSLHFGQSTYFNRTEYFSLAQKYAAIKSYLDINDKEGLKNYLSNNFLRNPLFNSDINIQEENGTKRLIINNPNSITHDWLRQLWLWANNKPCNRAFIEAMEHPIIRGLGIQDGYKEFKQFDLTENYRFTICHMMETFIKSKGKCILVPTMVLGDADSIRFVPSTTIDFGYNKGWRNVFINILKQDIADQRNFLNMAQYFVDNKTANTDGHPNSSYFNRDGSIKCCFNYFPELRQRYEAKYAEYLEGKKEGETNYDVSKRCLNDFIKDIEDYMNDTKHSSQDIYDEYLKASNDREIEEFKKSLITQGLAEEITEGTNKRVALRTGKSNPIFPVNNEGQNLYDKAFEAYTESKPLELDSLSILFLQYKYGLIQHIQFSGISPSFYSSFEDMQKRWKEHVAPGRTLDFAACDDSGKPVFTVGAGGYAYEQVAYFDDLKVNAWKEDGDWATLVSESGASKATADIYKGGSSVTDGESYRSLNSFRQIMIGAGEWQKNSANETVYQMIINERREFELFRRGAPKPKNTSVEDWEAHKKGRLSKREWRIIINSGICWQPLKPFMYTHEKITMDDGTVIDNPVQLKYAEVPLIPEFLPADSKLGMLGKAMDTNHIDLLASTKCVKVGAWDSIDISNLENATQEEINDAFLRKDDKGNPILDEDTNEPYTKSHLLSLQSYFLQNSIPDHMNTFRGEGTQVRKILGFTGTTEMTKPDGTPISELCHALIKYGNINIGEGLTIDTTKPLTGEEIQHLFTALESAGWVKSAKDFKDKLEDPIELNRMVENAIANSSTSANDQYQSLAFENEDSVDERGGTHKDLVRTIPLSEGLFSVDIMANLLSILRKRVVKQETNGGTAVQVAPTGMNLKVHYHYATEEDVRLLKEKNPNSKVQVGHPCNIDWVESAQTFDFKVTKNGHEIELDYLRYVDPETGYLLRTVKDKSGNVVVENGQPKKETINMNAKDMDKELASSDLCQAYPGIIDSIVYRVPTERAYSTIAVKAVRFFPKANGTIIAVPAHWTTVAGFDYDIDKLYFIRRQYVDDTYRVGETNKIAYNNEERYLIWKEIYREYPEVAFALKKSYIDNNANATEENFNVWAPYLNREWNRAANSSDPEVRRVIRKYSKNRLFDEVSDRLIREGKLKGVERRLNYFNPSTSLLEQPDYYINNLKFDSMWSRWTSPSTLIERITPGGFYNITKGTNLMKMITRNQLTDDKGLPFRSISEARQYAENYKDPYEDASDFTVVQGYQTSNVIYGALIGMAATQNILQKLLSMVPECNLVKVEEDPITHKNKFVDDHILFGSMVDRRKDNNVGHNLTIKYKGGIDSELMLAEYLASAVDAVKQGTLEYYNIRTNLFNIVALATRLGATPEDIGLLLNQPVVKEAINLMSSGQCYTFKTGMKMAFKHLSGVDYKTPTPDSNISIDSDALFMSIVNYEGGYKDNTTPKQQSPYLIQKQAAVMDVIIRLQDAAAEFGNLARNTRATSGNGTGSRISSLEFLIMSTDKTSKEFGNPDTGSHFSVNGGKGVHGEDQKLLDLDIELFDKAGNINPNIIETLATMPFGIENGVLLIMQDFMRTVCQKEFPYLSSGYIAVKNAFAKLGSKYNPESDKGILTDDMLNLINTELPTYLFARFAELHERPEDDCFDDEAKSILSMFSSAMYTVNIPIPGIEGASKTYNLLKSKREIFLKDFLDTLYNDLNRGKKWFKPKSAEESDLYFGNQIAILQDKDLQKKSARESIDKAVTNTLRRYTIMNMITVKENKDGQKYIVFSGVGKMDSTAKNEAIDSWSQLFADACAMRNNQDKKVRAVGERLYRIALGLVAYDFQTRGLGVFSRGTVNNLTPSDIKLSIPGYISFYRHLPELESDDDGNLWLPNPLTGQKECLGSIKEFIELLVVNQVSKSSSSIPIVYDFIHPLYDEVKELCKDPQIDHILKTGEGAVNGNLGDGSQDLKITIKDPANSKVVLWNASWTPKEGKNKGVTRRKMYPFIRIGDRIYEAVTGNDGYIPQTLKNGEQVLEVTYKLLVGSIQNSTRTTPYSKDFSDLSMLDKGVTKAGIIYEGATPGMASVNDISDDDIEITTYHNPLAMNRHYEKDMSERISNDLALPNDFLESLRTSDNPNDIDLYNTIMTLSILKAQKNMGKGSYWGSGVDDTKIASIIGEYLEFDSNNNSLIFKNGQSLAKMKEEAQKLADKQNLCIEI